MPPTPAAAARAPGRARPGPAPGRCPAPSPAARVPRRSLASCSRAPPSSCSTCSRVPPSSSRSRSLAPPSCSCSCAWPPSSSCRRECAPLSSSMRSRVPCSSWRSRSRVSSNSSRSRSRVACSSCSKRSRSAERSASICSMRPRLGQVGAQRACRALDRVGGAGIGERRLQRAHARLHLVGPLGQPALVGDRRLERGDLGARLLDLPAQVLLGLRGAREVAPDAVDGGADRLQLAPQPLALGAALLGLALEPLALLAHLVALAPPVCSRRSRRPSTWARISSSALRASDSPEPARAGLLQLGQARGRLGGLRLASPASARASARSAAVCSSACSTSPERSAGSPRQARRRLLGRRLVARKRRRQSARGAEGHDRARAQPVLLQLRAPLDGGVDPLDHGVMALPQLGHQVAARRGDLQGLEEAVELEALAHAHRHERQRDLQLVAVLAPDRRLDLAAGLGELGVQAQRLRQRAPEHARRRPAEQLLGGAAPARDRALTIGEHEAGVDELAQQLLNDLRGGGL